MNILIVILLAACGFVAAILNLAVDSRYKGRIMGFSALYAVVVGVLGYGYAYALTGGLSLSTVLRTLLTVCRMFGGVNDFAALAATPLGHIQIAASALWLAHFLAFYVTASAAIAVLGRQLLKRLRLRLLRRSAVTLIYGATPETLGLAKLPAGGRGLVFTASRDGIADETGGVTIESDTDVLIRRMGISGDRALTVYCLSPDPGANLRFAADLRDALRVRDVKCENLSLFLLGVPEDKAVDLLAGPERYGYGSLFACDRYQLTARLAIQKLPPWSLVPFDAEGRAQGDLRVMIVGFGQMGQAMLKQLVMNGQLEGSAFSAAVVDPDVDSLSGLIQTRFSAMLEAYDIQFFPEDARGAAFYRRLEADAPDLIALCAGNRAANTELHRALERFFELREKRPAILQCAEDSVIAGDREYRLEHISVEAMDCLSMVLNHVYCNGPSPEADWQGCDAFSRASCRASVDFYPAYLHIMGASDVPSLQRLWPPKGALLENLARTEHLRWCAFHLAMGYRPMVRQEFDARAQRFKAGEHLRVGKNTRDMTHACLTPWEQLDDLSRRESAVTGKPLDYKRMDVDNILAIPDIMRREQEP